MAVANSSILDFALELVKKHTKPKDDRRATDPKGWHLHKPGKVPSPILNKYAATAEGRWVTLHGTHVFIGPGGDILKGPHEFVGKKPDELGGEKPKDIDESEYGEVDTSNPKKSFEGTTPAKSRNHLEVWTEPSVHPRIQEYLRGQRSEPELTNEELTTDRAEHKRIHGRYEPYKYVSGADTLKGIQDAMAARKTSKDLKVYRVENWENPKAIYDQFQPGQVISKKGFTATSVNPNIHNAMGEEGKKVKFNVLLPKGTTAVPVSGSSSAFQDEMEVLLNHNQKFHVVSKKMEGDMPVVTLVAAHG